MLFKMRRVDSDMTRPREGHATSIRSSKGKEVVLLTKGFVTTRSSMNDVLRRGISAIVVAVVMVSTRSMIATSVEEADEGVEDESFSSRQWVVPASCYRCCRC